MLASGAKLLQVRKHLGQEFVRVVAEKPGLRLDGPVELEPLSLPVIAVRRSRFVVGLGGELRLLSGFRGMVIVVALGELSLDVSGCVLREFSSALDSDLG